MYKKLHETEGRTNENRVYLIKEVLNTMKKTMKDVSENRRFMIEGNKNTINIVDRTFYFNQLDQSGQGLKTPDCQFL